MTVTNKFTIAICTYNQSTMLQQTLNSINKLTPNNQYDIRLVVVDNNSADNTRDVCDEFAQISILPFTYYFEKNQGLSYARNRAINETNNGVIIFTDDDVIVPNDWINNYIEEYSSGDVSSVYGRIIPEWGDNKPAWFHKKLNPSYALLDYGDKRFIANSRYQEFYGANFSCTVSLLKELGSFDTRLGRIGDKLFIGEETEIFLKLLALKKTIIYSPKIFVWHVIREERKNKNFLIKYYRDIAESSVYVSTKNSRRNLFGIPLYRYKEFIPFYVSCLPKYLFYIITNNQQEKFILTLNIIKTNRSLYLYLYNFFVKPKNRL